MSGDWRFRARTRVALLAVGLLCLNPGCQKSERGDGLVEVTGLITHGGQPLPAGTPDFLGTISFGNVDRQSLGASGIIDSQGRYTLKQSRSIDGVAPGEYVVAIEAWEFIPGHPDHPQGVAAIDKKYFNVRVFRKIRGSNVGREVAFWEAWQGR